MSEIITDDAKIQDIVNPGRYIENIYPSPEFLEKRLKEGERLSIYIGVDPTAPDLHLGHTTNFIVLKKIQELGHKVIIVIGDFTARIGDPSGKDETRKPLTEKEVFENYKTYKQQIGKILDSRKTEFKQNSKWFEKISLKQFIEIASRVSVQQFLHRDMFQRRIKEESSIALHEFIYPLLQGYDSVAMNIDGEIGGTDQTFNMLIGKTLMKKLLNKEKFVITTKLLENLLTGKKLMSKSEGNYISIQDSSYDIYSKTMALPDEVIFSCFELCTEVTFDRINLLKSGDILNAKEELAYEITKIYHGEKGAGSAREEFNKVFRQGELPQKISEVRIDGETLNIIDLILKTGLVPSSSEAKRLISQNAVKVGEEIISDWKRDIKIENGLIIKIGPRKFIKIKK